METIRNYFKASERFELQNIDSAINFANSEQGHINERLFVESVDVLRSFTPFFLTFNEMHLRQFAPNDGISSKIKMLVIAAQTAELNSRFAVLHIAVAVTEEVIMGSNKIKDHVQRVLIRIGGIRVNGESIQKKILAVICDGCPANEVAVQYAYHYAHIPVLTDYTHLDITLSTNYKCANKILRRVYRQTIYKKSSWQSEMDAADAAAALSPHWEYKERELRNLRLMLGKFFDLCPSDDLSLHNTNNDDLETFLRCLQSEIVSLAAGHVPELNNITRAPRFLLQFAGVFMKLLEMN
ncbi:uncharacterized protein LOC111075821 [Drosophila obscura]|uniref:uncharacterized protein LOC111075821 n=1 Tax=Drosophila obscura TaxID=7282 RepID=UPI001BB27431|nr:uncharacterized protein LOC111075821 [Drosophila obscura]